MRLQARDRKLRCKDILELPDLCLEVAQRFRACITALVRLAGDHEPFELFRSHKRRQIGQRQEVFVLEVAAFLCELLTALAVDQCSHRIRERTLGRVSARKRSDAVHLNHPAATQAAEYD